MQKSIVTTGLVMFSLVFPLKASAANFSEIYVFGDSLSDTGNLFDLTGQPPAPYFDGRFSNGPLWVEYLAEELGLTPNPATNFAFGGAITGIADPSSPPGLPQQIGFFTNSLKF